MAGGTNWNKDIPWLGAWIPLSCVLVAIGALLASVGVPMFILGLVGPLVAAGVYLYLWGPRGRFVRSPSEENPSPPDSARASPPTNGEG